MIVINNSSLIEDINRGFITSVICEISCLSKHFTGINKKLFELFPVEMSNYFKLTITKNMFGEVVKLDTKSNLTIFLCFTQYFAGKPSEVSIYKNNEVIIDNSETRLKTFKECMIKVKEQLTNKDTVGAPILGKELFNTPLKFNKLYDRVKEILNEIFNNRNIYIYEN